MSMQGCTQGRMRNRMNADMEKRFTPLMRLYHNEIPGLLQELYEIADSFSRNDGKGLDDPGIEH